MSKAHLGDSLNWNYSIQFAEGGKYKHVLTYYDGLLKNRQTITRFNSSPDKLLVTENVYDYEGRAAISTLPAVVRTSAFNWQDSVSTSSITGLAYQASDFDKKPLACPDNAVLPPFAPRARSNFYYSSLNTDTLGAQKFLPKANGFPFVHTQLSPGFSDRVDRQGAPGLLLQINNGHDMANYYVSAEQKNLNSLFGLNAGIASYYNKTVSKDQNGQLSMAIKDFRGKLVASSYLGTVDTAMQALINNTEVPTSKLVSEDKLAGALQAVVGNQKKWSGTQFMDVNANNAKVKYVYNATPFQVCASPNYVGLTAAAIFDYSINEACGTEELNRSGMVGTSGICFSPTPNPSALDIGTVNLSKGQHIVNKTLSVPSASIIKAVDSFVNYALANPTATCLSTENQFIKESVDAISLPCTEIEDANPCAILKKQMMEDLFPNNKYGTYYIEPDRGLGYTTVAIEASIFFSPLPEIYDSSDLKKYRYNSPCVLSALNTLSISCLLYTSDAADE